MSAFAAQTGKNWDGTLSGATGSVSYTPSRIDQNGVAIWTLAGDTYDAEKRLSLSVRRPTKGSQVIREQVKLVHPVMDATDDTLKIGENLVNLEIVFHKKSTVEERNLLMGHLVEFLQNSTTFAAAVQDYESVF